MLPTKPELFNKVRADAVTHIAGVAIFYQEDKIVYDTHAVVLANTVVVDHATGIVSFYLGDKLVHKIQML